MQLKICGMRDPENCLAIAELHPTYMGFIFYPPSPRFVSQIPIRLIEQLKTRDIRPVAVFVNESVTHMLKVVRTYGIPTVQLHGQETPNVCKQLTDEGLEVFKAFSIASSDDFQPVHAYEGYCSRYIFDTKTSQYGGSGKTFDWSLLEKHTGATPFLLSGGIGLEETSALLQLVHPKLIGFDVNSRFEWSPGIKNKEQLHTFIQTIQKQHDI